MPKPDRSPTRGLLDKLAGMFKPKREDEPLELDYDPAAKPKGVKPRGRPY